MTAAVQYLWTGTPTPDGCQCSARLSGSAATVRMVVDTDPSLAVSPLYSSATVTDAYSTLKLAISGLLANTNYYYGLEIDGVLDTVTTGRFKTLPAVNAPASFRFAFGACSYTGSDAAFTAIADLATRPLFMLHMGDLHYENIAEVVTTPAEVNYLAAYSTVMSHAERHRMMRQIPTLYIYDDHDFGGNDVGGKTISGTDVSWRDKPIAAYRRRVPVTPANPSATAACYSSFVVGRLRVILSDLRADRLPKANADSAAKTMMGAVQKQWFKDEIAAASAANQIVAWVSSVSYASADGAGSDTWSGYATERAELADYIKSKNMGEKVFVLCGDMHALAVHSGADYATGSGAALPVFQSAPLQQTSSIRGGPYTLGPYPATEGLATTAYSIMDVVDNGLSMTISYKGYTADGVERLNYSRTFLSSSTRFNASGGTVSIPGDGYKYWRFNSSADLIVTTPGVAEYCVVGGGGSGTATSNKGGGGGGGGLATGLNAFALGTYPIVVGAGAVADGFNGGNSSIGSLVTAYGGGYGGTSSFSPNAGGSGGGGGASTSASRAGGAGSPGQGNAGGRGNHTGTAALCAGGGGGGAGAVGEAGNVSTGKGGDGGAGREWPLGSGTYYGGGGGGSGGTTQGAGGVGGGTAGRFSAGAVATPAANTGGGSGAPGASSTAAPGGSGVVIIRAPYRRYPRTSGWLQ